MVVSVEDLFCLDALLWLGGGETASQRVAVSASTVSRSSRKVAAEFGVELVKGQGEYSLLGDVRHLDLERLVHQRLRWDRGGQLRIEAQYYSGPLLTEGIGKNYLLGNFDFLDIRKPIQFLKSGVIDAWIAGYPDVPPHDDALLCSIDLTRLPLRLVVSPEHPLLRLGQAVSLDDVAQYPCIALADGAFPESQKILEAKGLWNTPARIRRYNKDNWLGLTSDQVTVGYASIFSIKLFPEPMVFLPLDLNFDVGETLVVKREFVDHPRCKALLQFLKERAIELSAQYDDVSLAF
mgnify:CR=1 FL=1